MTLADEILPSDPYAFTVPVYTPDQVRAWYEGSTLHIPDLLAPLHILLPELKRRIGPIGKTGQMTAKENQETGEKKGPTYAFRKIEDILNEGHGPLCDLGISWRKVRIVSHTLSANGKAQQCVMEVVYELVGPLGDTVRTTAVGQAVDFGSDKATNKADTAARKNMLVDLLQLATEDPDSERPDRLDERPQVQQADATKAVAAINRVKALTEQGREQVKGWAAERGVTVTARALTVAQLNQLTALVASIEKREKELAEAEAAAPDTVAEGMARLEDAVERAKEARERHPQPPASAPAAPNGEAATDAAGDLDGPALVTEQHQSTLLAEIRKLSNDQRAEVAGWATNQGIDIETANLPNLTVDDFTRLMTAIRNTLRAGSVGTAKKAAGRPAQSRTAKKAPAAPPVDEEALAARQALRAGLIGRAELLPADLQDQFLTELAKNDGPAGMSIGDAIEACPPAWDRWLEKAVERAEARLALEQQAADEAEAEELREMAEADGEKF